MHPTRSALIIASDTYEDLQLAQLRAPGRDAEALAEVLRDPVIGGFDVQVSMNQRHYEVRIALEDFFANRGPEDVLLLHFSCHGIKDEAGRLFFAAADTQRSRLNATAIAAEYVNDLLNQARSRRVVLLLDCCFSGAFTRGMVARGGHELDVTERFHGRGRAVLTAAGALEYAWEGDDLTRLNEPSVFTSAVVRGLRSGEADRDGDQQVSVDELYDYVYEEVRGKTPNQTPGKWSNVEGKLIVARSPRPARTPASLSADLQQAIEDERSWVRAGAIEPLAQLLRGADSERAHAARQALQRLAQDDSRRVSSLAKHALDGSNPFTAEDNAVDARSDPAPTEMSERVSRISTMARSGWLPSVVLAGGWIVAWLVCLSLASSSSVSDMVGAVTLALVGWVIVAPLVAAALRWASPGLSTSRALLVGLGWPVCMTVGLGAPIILRLGEEGALLLGLSVAAAGLLGTVALTAPEGPIPWERVLMADAGWCAGWLWSGATAWPLAFWTVANQYASTFAGLLDIVSFAQLAAGGVMSGAVGGALMVLFLRGPNRHVQD